MTDYNGIQTPCYGTLEEIHAALIKDLNWLDEQVTINGYGFTVKESGFQNNGTGTCKTPEMLKLIAPGMAILCGQHEAKHGGVEIFDIVTCGKIPHISLRCICCGIQLNQDEIKRGACDPCYAAEVAGDDLP
jgi:hypothetical protein